MVPANYNEWHNENKNDTDRDSVWHKFVKGKLKGDDLSSLRVLEIGCGRGGLSDHLATNDPSLKVLFACDFSQEAIDIAKKKFGTHSGIVIWQKEDIQALSFDSQSFDRIISCETVEHVPNPDLALKELHRVLKPGGKLYLTCPNYFNLLGIWCIYRKLIGKPFTEGGQPYVRYILFPLIFKTIVSLKFSVKHFHSTELIIPLRTPKTLYPSSAIPFWLAPFGYRTNYLLIKK